MYSTLIKNVTIITMDSSESILDNHSVFVDDGKIARITDDIVEIQILEHRANTVMDGSNKYLMPGFVNSHTHSPMVLLRGYGEGKNLHDWLFNCIFPAEDSLTDNSAYNGAMLAIAEMLLNGVTCFADQYFFCEAIARAVLKTGIKANLSRGLQCFDNDFNPLSDYRLIEAEELYKKYNNANQGQIKVWVGPHSVYTCVPRYLRETAKLAERLNTGIHIHLSETIGEVDNSLNEFGETPVAHCMNCGIFDSGPTLAAHCVHLRENDKSIIDSYKNISIVHNPASNLKLASGIAPISDYLQAGKLVALGTDGAASNNDLDIIKEMRLSALLSKVRQNDPLAINAWQALYMATKNGAAALGFDNAGIIREGMDADIVLLAIDTPNMAPSHDIVANLVYSATNRNVTDVFINGKLIVSQGKLQFLDIGEIIVKARKSACDLVRGSRTC